MAQLSKWTIFLRAFIVALIATQPTRVGGQTSAEDQAWRYALQTNTAQAYHGYLSQYPAGKYVREAIGAIQRLGALPAPPRNRSVAPQNTAPQREQQSRAGAAEQSGLY